MLQIVRDHLVGWVAWGVLILIGVPFVFMGITDFGSSVKEVVVADVDGETISQQDYRRRYQMSLQNLKKQLGASYRPDLFDKTIQESVIDAMIEEKLVAMLAEENGLHVGDEELSSVIRRNPAFQQDGKFDYSLYQSRLGQSGLTLGGYEDFLREDRAATVILRMVRQSSFLTPQQAKRYSTLSDQKRDIDYVLIGEENIAKDIEIQNEQVKAYYDNHLSEFIRPAQVKFEYVQLNASQLASRVQVTDEDIRRYYDEDVDRYVVDEQRAASHILLPLKKGESLEDSPEVFSKLNEIQQKLESGEPFEALARQYSGDPGSAQQGGSLGQVMRGMMVPPFEKALFALSEKGQISEPVHTSFGVHLIQLDGITPRKVKSFDEVKAEVSANLSRHRALDLYYELSERMIEVSYENPDRLGPAAEVVDLKVQTSDWVSADNSAPGIEGHQDVLRAVFSERLRTEMINSDPIEIGENEVVVVRVKESRPKHQLEFGAVVDQAYAVVRQDVIEQKIKEYASSLLSRYQAGETLQQLAEKENLSVETVNGLARQGNDLPAELVRGVFSLSASSGDQSRISLTSLNDSKVALVNLRKVTFPDVQDVTAMSAQKTRHTLDESGMLLAELRKKAQIVIYKDKL